MLGIATNNPNTFITSFPLDGKNSDRNDNTTLVFFIIKLTHIQMMISQKESNQWIIFCNRYELVNNKLVHPKLLLTLPTIPGPIGNG
jgi:hypothetical protein